MAKKYSLEFLRYAKNIDSDNANLYDIKNPHKKLVDYLKEPKYISGHNDEQVSLYTASLLEGSPIVDKGNGILRFGSEPDIISIYFRPVADFADPWNPKVTFEFKYHNDIEDSWGIMEYDVLKTPSVFLKRGWRYKFIPANTMWATSSGYPSISSGTYFSRFMHFRDGSQIGDVPLKCFPLSYTSNYDDDGSVEEIPSAPFYVDLDTFENGDVIISAPQVVGNTDLSSSKLIMFGITDPEKHTVNQHSTYGDFTLGWKPFGITNDTGVIVANSYQAPLTGVSWINYGLQLEDKEADSLEIVSDPWTITYTEGDSEIPLSTQVKVKAIPITEGEDLQSSIQITSVQMETSNLDSVEFDSVSSYTLNSSGAESTFNLRFFDISLPKLVSSFPNSQTHNISAVVKYNAINEAGESVESSVSIPGTITVNQDAATLLVSESAINVDTDNTNNNFSTTIVFTNDCVDITDIITLAPHESTGNYDLLSVDCDSKTIAGGNSLDVEVIMNLSNSTGVGSNNTGTIYIPYSSSQGTTGTITLNATSTRTPVVTGYTSSGTDGITSGGTNLNSINWGSPYNVSDPTNTGNPHVGQKIRWTGTLQLHRNAWYGPYNVITHYNNGTSSTDTSSYGAHSYTGAGKEKSAALVGGAPGSQNGSYSTAGYPDTYLGYDWEVDITVVAELTIPITGSAGEKRLEGIDVKDLFAGNSPFAGEPPISGTIQAPSITYIVPGEWDISGRVVHLGTNMTGAEANIGSIYYHTGAPHPGVGYEHTFEGSSDITGGRQFYKPVDGGISSTSTPISAGGLITFEQNSSAQGIISGNGDVPSGPWLGAFGDGGDPETKSYFNITANSGNSVKQVSTISGDMEIREPFSESWVTQGSTTLTAESTTVKVRNKNPNTLLTSGSMKVNENSILSWPTQEVNEHVDWSLIINVKNLGLLPQVNYNLTGGGVDGDLHNDYSYMNVDFSHNINVTTPDVINVDAPSNFQGIFSLSEQVLYQTNPSIITFSDFDSNVFSSGTVAVSMYEVITVTHNSTSGTDVTSNLDITSHSPVNRPLTTYTGGASGSIQESSNTYLNFSGSIYVPSANIFPVTTVQFKRDIYLYATYGETSISSGGKVVGTIYGEVTINWKESS